MKLLDCRQAVFRPVALGFGTAANTELDVVLSTINTIFDSGSAGQLFVSNGASVPAFSNSVSANISFLDTIGVGTTFEPGQAVSTYIAGTNESLTGISNDVVPTLSNSSTIDQTGINTLFLGTQSASNSSNLVGIRSDFEYTISSGITNSGEWQAIQANGIRQGGSGDVGTLSEIISVLAQYGNLSTGSAAITSNTYGVYVTPYWSTGTVSAAYGLYIAAAETGGTGPTTGGIGSIGNYYGIYQQDANAQNFFNGIIRLGSTAAPGSGNRPVSVNAENQLVVGANTYTAPTVQRFLSGSGTYTPTSPNILYLKVRAVGGGGGGGAGGGSGSTPGGMGGTTTLGPITCSGGSGGVEDGVAGVGGTTSVTVTSGVSILADPQGASGNAAINSAAEADWPGGSGGASPFGGAGGGGFAASPPTQGIANTGSGGGGAGTIGANVTGSGGGAGGYAEVLISGTALATIVSSGASFSVGTGGTAGTGNSNGAAGGSGIIIIEECYQ